VGGGEGSYYGGYSYSNAIAVDLEGNVLVMGTTSVPFYPTTPGAFDDTYNGGRDVYLSKLDRDLSTLLASTYLGGDGREAAPSIVVDFDNHIIIGGATTSSDFPTLADAFDRVYEHEQDIYVVKMQTKSSFISYDRVHIAAQRGDEDLLLSLVERSPELVYAVDSYNRSPLHWASKFGYEDIISTLISKGANVNLQDIDGNTPLHLASLFDRSPAVQLLVTNGADTNLKNVVGDTPLHLAALTGNDNVVSLLIDAGIDVDTQNNAGNTALHRAVFSRQLAITRTLLTRGAEASIIDNDGNTPLHLVSTVFLGDEIIDILLSFGADTGKTNAAGQIPLHMAAGYSWERNAVRLIEGNSMLDVVDQYGKTPLIYAAERGFTGIVTALLEKGARVSIRDLDGKTARDWAEESGHEEIIRLIEEAE